MEVVSQCASHTSATPADICDFIYFFPPQFSVCTTVVQMYFCACSLFEMFLLLYYPNIKKWEDKKCWPPWRMRERDCGAIIGRTPSFHKSELTNLKFISPKYYFLYKYLLYTIPRIPWQMPDKVLVTSCNPIATV